MAKSLEGKAKASRSTKGKMDLLFDCLEWNPLRVVLADGRDVEMVGLIPDDEVATKEWVQEAKSFEGALKEGEDQCED